MKLAKTIPQLNVRENFFGIRVVNLWNGFPVSITTDLSIYAFKGRLDWLSTERKERSSADTE